MPSSSCSTPPARPAAPKGVLHSHNTIMSEIDAVIRFWGIDARDVVLMPSPVTHITGYLYALELAFAAGVKVVLMERWNADAAVDLIAASRRELQRRRDAFPEGAGGRRRGARNRAAEPAPVHERRRAGAAGGRAARHPRAARLPDVPRLRQHRSAHHHPGHPRSLGGAAGRRHRRAHRQPRGAHRRRGRRAASTTVSTGRSARAAPS